ncbi:hypothetical protein SLE2022_318410 [Rubroshorea leprosula]
MADIVGAIFGALSFICGTPICNYIDQYQNFHDDVAKLKRDLGSLMGKKEDIESRIEGARGGQTVRHEVQIWREQAEEINVDVKAILKKVQGAKWYKRVSLDKCVCRKINVVKEMSEKGGFPEGLFNERVLVHENIIPTENLVGENSTIEEIWGYLMGTEIGMIGVYGIGGVGKTAIMQNLYNDLWRAIELETINFKKVIWVTVSHSMDDFELQKKIADSMGETLQGNEPIMRAGALMEIMRKVNFVLILDDVRQKFYLKNVGIPDPKVHKGCKVVVISRLITVCDHLCCQIVEVKPLSHDDSLKLFVDKVGDDVLQVPGLEEILKLIVIECVGLPLVIIMTAESMRRVVDVNVWKNALIELRYCGLSMKDSNDEIFKQLRLRFDWLRISFLEEGYGFYERRSIESGINEGLIDGLPSRKVVLQNLEMIYVDDCEQMEEIIASSLDKFTFTFLKLRELCLWYLPQLKCIYSAKAVVLDHRQPSLTPHFREIRIGEMSKEWWESLEWDHPNAKNLLQPFLK